MVDLETADKEILPKQYRVQREALVGLAADWSRVVDEEGQQLMTVGHHFRHSRPLNDEERLHIQRSGVCLSCHPEIPDQSFGNASEQQGGDITASAPGTDNNQVCLDLIRKRVDLFISEARHDQLSL